MKYYSLSPYMFERGDRVQRQSDGQEGTVVVEETHRALVEWDSSVGMPEQEWIEQHDRRYLVVGRLKGPQAISIPIRIRRPAA